MSRLENFNRIVDLAKSANNKKMSELSLEQQHAVLFLGKEYPAELKEGLPKYSRTSDKHTIACSYVEARKLAAALGSDKKFQQNTYHVFNDISVSFEEKVNVEALGNYPDKLQIPIKTSEYSHLEPLLPQKVTLEYPKIRVSAMICRVYAGLVNGVEMGLEEKAVHFVIHKYKDSFKTLAEALKLTALTTAILNYEPELTKRPKGSIAHKDTPSSMSYLATYLYYAYLGIYLKVEEEI